MGLGPTKEPGVQCGPMAPGPRMAPQQELLGKGDVDCQEDGSIWILWLKELEEEGAGRTREAKGLHSA